MSRRLPIVPQPMMDELAMPQGVRLSKNTRSEE
jgi:hypothetical protein